MSLLRGLHHVALATRSVHGPLARSLGALGLHVPDVFRSHPAAHSLIGHVHVPFASTHLEWVSPLGGRPRVHAALGVSNAFPPLHHVAFKVSSLQEAAQRVPLICKGIGADGHSVAFIDPKATEGAIIELVEEKDPVDYKGVYY